MPEGKTFPLSLVVKAVDNATAPLRKINERVSGLAQAATRASAGLSLAVSAPLAAIGAASVAAFSRFEAGMANVSTLVDTSKESLDAMGASVLAISRRVPVAVGDLTEALYEARSAGVSAADQFRVLEGSARLAVVGLGTTKEAIDLVTSSVNAFGLQGAEAERVYNLIFQATNTGKTTISGLAQGFGGVAGTVASAGVKLDEYLASVAALTTTGLPAAEAHTQLRAVISGLTRQTNLTRAVFQKLGAKDLKGLIATSGGLVPALDRIKEVLRGNDTAMLTLLGSTEALNATLGLTGGQAAAFRSTLETMRNGTDGLGAAFEKQNRTAAATTQRLQNALEGVSISIGRIVVPVLQQLAPVLERAATWWESLGAEGQKSVVIFGASVAALGPVIGVLGNLATVVGVAGKAISFVAGWGQYFWMMRASILAALVPSLKAAVASVWSFTAALLANPITWVIAGVAALAGVVYLVYRNWEPIKAFFMKTWETIKSAVGPAVDWIWDKLKRWTVLGMIVENWEPIRDFFSNLWDGIVSAFKAAWSAISPIVDRLKPLLEFVPFGGAITAADRLITESPQASPLGAERLLSASQRSEATVKVDFANLPRGARVMPAANNTADLDLSVGFSMVNP